MIALIQRVLRAAVSIADQEVGAIGPGMLALVAVVSEDDAMSVERMAERLLDYRIFSDAAGRMNLSLRDTGGGLLLVPQFTLAADTTRGNRPSFGPAAEPRQAQALFAALLERAHALHSPVATGQFGAHMQVSLVNDGPVTFWLTAGSRGIHT
jgi:D-aminoacyl-tRNA deacylase